MPRFRILLLALWLGLPGLSWAGIDPTPVIGGRPAGLGYAYTGVYGDVWSLYANPAGIAGGQGWQVGTYYEQRFRLPDLAMGYAGGIVALPGGQAAGVAMSLARLGGWSQRYAGAAYAITLFERVRLGVRAGYLQVGVEGHGTASTIRLDVGAQVSLTETLTLGSRVHNASQARFLNQTGLALLPPEFSVGLAYRPGAQVLLVADLVKNPDFPLGYRIGVEYRLHEWLYVRTGMAAAPGALAAEALSFTAGLGIKWRDLQVDFAASHTRLLGYSPHLSLSYAFGERASRT